jgi:competence ComEA-like helix-hairpin-helix protein
MNSRQVEWRKLKRLEREAREQRIGGWGIGAGRLKTRAPTQPAASLEAFPHLRATPSPASEPPSDAKLNVNSASLEALRDLPGIGLVLAKRIIATRPFQSANDLRRVQGIGAKRYEQLRPYFQ